jgi:hypothetical protein
LTGRRKKFIAEYATCDNAAGAARWAAKRPFSVMYRRRAAYRCIAARVCPQAHSALWLKSSRNCSGKYEEIKTLQPV